MCDYYIITYLHIFVYKLVAIIDILISYHASVYLQNLCHSLLFFSILLLMSLVKIIGIAKVKAKRERVKVRSDKKKQYRIEVNRKQQ